MLDGAEPSADDRFVSIYNREGQSVLDQVRSLVESGFAIHPLKPRSKAPIDSGWSTAEPHTFSSLRKVFREGMNLGVRLGEPSLVDGRYLHVIDMDIRVEDETDDAWDALEKLFPGVRINRLPRVQSGSRGESRHFYFVCDEAFPSRKIATSGKKFTDKQGNKHWTWEIEIFGTGKQVALPPSIHPDTGKTYRWEVEPEFDIGFPVIDAGLIGDLVYGTQDEDADPADTEILGLSYAEAEDFLADLDLDIWCEDRDHWRDVGMALHHEFEGSKDAFRVWVQFSKQSRKFDYDVCKQQWKSFGRYTGRPIRMATIMAAAKDSRIRRDFDEIDERDDEPFQPDSAGLKKTNDRDPDLTILRQSPYEAPPFPTHLFGKFWAKQIARIAENASAPEDFVGAALLAVAASLIGNSTWVSPRKGWSEPPILWCQAIGLPSANKSPAFSPFIGILNDLEKRWVAPHTAAHRQWENEKKIADMKRKRWEAIANKKIEEGEDPGEMPEDCYVAPEPGRRRAYMTDATIEATLRTLAANPRSFISFRDEMTSWYANLGRYSGGGSDRPIWLEAYGGRPYVVDRVKDEGKPVVVDRFAIGILGGLQPDRLMEMVLGAKDGLQDRFLPFWPERAERPFSEGVELGDDAGEALGRLSELMMKKGENGLEPHIAPFTPEARRHFGEWVNRHNEVERYAHERLKNTYGKANGHVARIALVLELLWWCEDDNYDPPQQVSIEAVRAAIEFRERYLVPMQRRVIGHGLQSAEAVKAKAIANWIIETRPDRINISTMRREAGIEGISGKTPSSEVDDAVAYLVSLNWLREERIKTKGRPTYAFYVNERVYELLDES